MPLKIFRFSQNIEVCQLNISQYTQELSKDIGHPIVHGTNNQAPTRHFKNNKFLAESFSKEEMQELNSFKTLKRQIEWSAGRVCVKKLSKEIVPQSDEGPTVSYYEGGAPYLRAAPKFHISISHSGEYAMALIHRGSGKATLDIQTLEIKDINPIKKFILSEREIKQGIQYIESIIQLFTIKEAFLKYTGRGFREGVKNIEILDNKIYHKSIPQDQLAFFSCLVDNSHMATILFEKDEKINENEVRLSPYIS